MSLQIRTALVIPSYNESLALPNLLVALQSELDQEVAVLVMDDSEISHGQSIRARCEQIAKTAKYDLYYFGNFKKTGRGASVRRGMVNALSSFPNLDYILECDADGSHQLKDIIRLLNCDSTADLVIGSRYLPDSKIVGWPKRRRVFSRLLNLTIPKILLLPISDITNGLRRYSRVAVKRIVEVSPSNRGFIYLAEQALILKQANMIFDEIPITFADRTHGQSTVTNREIREAIKGLVGLVRNSKFRK